MIRHNYHLRNGVVGIRKPNDKQTRKYDYQSKLVKDCVSELRKGREAFCYTDEQLEAIATEMPLEVKYEWLGWCYRIWRT